MPLPDGDTRFDFSSVRVCVSAGEALPADIQLRWKQKFHVDILDGIGSTEILHIFLSNREGEIRPGSTGKVVPGYEAKIVDEHGQPVAQGAMGALLIRGESTTAYYWNKHQAHERHHQRTLDRNGRYLLSRCRWLFLVLWSRRRYA